MKYILTLLTFVLICGSINAQFASAKKTYTKKGYKSNANRIFLDPNDSANIYYGAGWQAYSAGDFGAARWYWERAANCNTNARGRWASAFRLALLHQEGQGVGVNYDLALYYYTLAWADGRREGESEGTKNIAACYEIGRGVTQDLSKALEWYEKAKAQGNKYCNTDIARVKNKLRSSIK